MSAQKQLIDTYEDNGLLVHVFKDPETGEEWEETSELEHHHEETEETIEEIQEGRQQPEKSQGQNKKNGEKAEQGTPGSHGNSRGNKNLKGNNVSSDPNSKKLDLNDTKEFLQDPRGYVQERAKQELKRELKKELKKQAEKKLAEYGVEGVSEILAPIAIGCIVILVAILLIALIIIFAIAVFTKDEAAATTNAGTTKTKICLDAGHGGQDSGAVYPINGTPTLKEKDMNLTIATELKPKLETAGYEVIMTRTNDVQLRPGDNETESIERSSFCSKEGTSLMYRIHLDASTEPQRTFHIAPGPKYGNIHDDSLKYAQKIHEAMIKELGGLVKNNGKPLKDGGVIQEGTKNYTRTLKGTVRANELSLPIIWLEAIAINKEGVNWIENSSNRGKLEDAIVKGFLAAIGPGGGNAKTIIERAKYYVTNPNEYKAVAVRDFTDCGGFVMTVLKETGIDPELAAFGGRARDFIDYFKSKPEKYTIVSENVTGTSNLKPGDIILNADFGSHAAIYIGESGKNKAEASLNKHGPEYGNWYSKLHIAVRLK